MTPDSSDKAANSIPSLGAPEIPEGVSDLFRLDGLKAVVVGGGTGINRAISIGFAKFGASVAVVDLDMAMAKETQAAIRNVGVNSWAYQADATNPSDLARVSKAINSPIDICVAGVGGGMRSKVIDTSREQLRSIVSLNLESTFNTARAFYEQLSDGGGGSFISFSSIHGHVVDPLQGAYASAKAGVVHLTRVLALEWASAGIRANSIAPSHFFTRRVKDILDNPDEYARIVERSPMSRFGMPWEVIGPAVFLASRASSFVTGQSLLVDGGWTLS